MIQVRASQPGYYGHYRETDEEFEIDDESAFSETWMVRLAPKKFETKIEKSSEKK